MAAHRDAVLREMGLGPVWRLRGRERLDDAPRGVEEDIATTAAPDEGANTAPQPQAARSSEHPRQAAGSPAQPAAERIPRRTVIPPAAPPRPPAPQQAAPLAPVDPARSARIASLDWDALEADIRNCRACRLCEKRQQAVPGVGDQRASWMLVGEGPGAEEDQRGEPFVGAAGQLLDNMLAAIGLRRGEDVFIANAVKCRPPFNRTPEADEIAACLPYLERQIALIQPRLIVALGRPAAQALLNTEVRIGAARGHLFKHGNHPVVVTYHPAYLLRNQADKAKAWEDLCFARREMARLQSRG